MLTWGVCGACLLQFGVGVLCLVMEYLVCVAVEHVLDALTCLSLVWSHFPLGATLD